MKNNISDLADILFEQLDRIQDDTGELDLDAEVKRADAMIKVADKILDVGRLEIDAMKISENFNLTRKEMPALLENKSAKGAI